VDHEVPAASAARGGGDARTGSDPGYLRTKRSVDHERVSKDHVHLLISLPPQVTISRLMQWLKGRTAHHLLAEFPHLKKQFWGRHLWARGYFCCSSGNVTDDVIAKYIAEQNVDQDEDFKVDG
jgi:putative transposase